MAMSDDWTGRIGEPRGLSQDTTRYQPWAVGTMPDAAHRRPHDGRWPAEAWLGGRALLMSRAADRLPQSDLQAMAGCRRSHWAAVGETTPAKRQRSGIGRLGWFLFAITVQTAVPSRQTSWTLDWIGHSESQSTPADLVPHRRSIPHPRDAPGDHGDQW